ncbi:phage tail tape measure protein [Streptomyces sp. NPDC087422]|uniref:phage tail tape measure protein n=1 Tax=Streptomyces sp. NPDC087422 TaxID=3365786 RepID=UPI00380B0012
MVDRVVRTRLVLDTSGWAAGTTRADASNRALASSATAAATTADRAAQRTAAAVAGTFTNMARQGEASMGRLDAAATLSSQALARQTTAMTRQVAAAAAAAASSTTQAAATAAAATTAAATGSASAATAAAATTTQAAGAAAAATTQGAATTAAATRQIATAAGTIPAAFRAATTAATGSLAGLDVTAAASRAAVARTLVTQRQALTGAATAVTQVSTGMTAATASAAAGTARLSLATRLALGEAATASQAAAASAAAAAARVSTSSALAARGATRAADAAAAAAARADARTAAAAAGTVGTFGRIGTAATTMGSRVATGAAASERSLKGARSASLLLVAAFGLAVYANSRFEKAMSGVKAATQAESAELVKLRAAALQAGASTQFSATQSADAITELAKAGVSTSDILGGALRGTLSLAAAGDMDVADSAVVAAKAMNSFGLSGKDMAHIADVLAAAAGKSATDVHGMALAFSQSGLLAHQTGLSLEQTAGSLALFAQNGLVGSDAGTSLKTMLMRLTPQSQEARDMMDKLGFSAYDSAGQFVGLSETAARMQKSFGSLTPEARNAAMGVIFGSDAIRAATIVTEAGAAGIDTWTKASADQGYATRYAATQTDNLSGDLVRLKSVLETALIQSGSAANGVLRDMAKALADAVRWYSELSPSTQKTVTVLGGMVGVSGLVAASLLLMLPRIMAVRRELVSLGLTAARTKTLMSGLGRLGLVVGVLTALTIASDKLTNAMKKPAPDVDKLTNSLIDLADTGKKTGAAGKELDGFGDAVARIAHPSTLNRLDDVASSVGHLGLTGSKVGSLTEAKDKITALDKALSALVANGASDKAAEAFKVYAAEAEKGGTSTAKFRSLLPGYAKALTETDTQQKLATGSQKALADQSDATADSLRDTTTQAEKLAGALDALNGVNIDVATSEIGFRQSLADMRQEVKDNGLSLDVTTDKGRKVKSAFLDAAKSAMDHAKAVATQKDSVEAGNKALAEYIAILKQQMLQEGFEKEAVDGLLKSYARVPGQVTTAVKVKDESSKELASIQDKLAKTKDKSITVKALTAAGEKSLKQFGFNVTHLPNGTVKISVPTSKQDAALRALKARLDDLKSKTLRITIEQQVKSGKLDSRTAKNIINLDGRADGGIVGMKHAANGLFVPGYQPHVDSVPTMLSRGEGVLVPEAVKKLGLLSGLGSAGVIKQLNSWGRYGSALRMANGGVVGGGVQRFADGGIAYTPTASPTLGGTGDAMDRYNAALAKLQAAWKTLTTASAAFATQSKQLAAAESKASQIRRDGARRVGQAEDNLDRVRSRHHTAAQLAAAEDRLTNARAAAAKANKAATASVNKERTDVKTARNAVATAKSGVYSADAALGVAKGAKAPTGFNLGAYQSQLTKSVAATNAWRASLTKIATRGGQELSGVLESMGEDGYALVQALAKANNKQFADISNKLLKQAGIAKASLADFNAQVNASTKVNATFAADLQKLAGEGYGDLAKALAAQGDAAAQALAHEAAGSTSKAAAANSTVKSAGAVLTGDDLANSLVLLSTLRGGAGRGYAELLAAGLTTATIQALVPRMMGQLNSLPAEYKTTFLAQWAQQGGVTAMARGGILTRPTAVLAAEAGAAESWIPWNGSARSAALLAQTAAGMGYTLVPAGRYAGGGGQQQAQAGPVTHHTEVHLHGAKQTAGEQAADIARHLIFVG